MLIFLEAGLHGKITNAGWEFYRSASGADSVATVSGAPGKAERAREFCENSFPMHKEFSLCYFLKTFVFVNIQKRLLRLFRATMKSCGVRSSRSLFNMKEGLP